MIFYPSDFLSEFVSTIQLALTKARKVMGRLKWRTDISEFTYNFRVIKIMIV